MSIQFLNQFDKNPLHVLQIVGLVFVELVLGDEFLGYHILQFLHLLCAACYKSCLLLCSHLADPDGPFAPSEFNTSFHESAFVIRSHLVAM